MSQAYIGYDLQNALHEELNRGIEHLPNYDNGYASTC